MSQPSLQAMNPAVNQAMNQAMIEAKAQAITEAMTCIPSFDGDVAQLVHLCNRHGMCASFMDIGATWLSCALPVQGELREVLLRSPDMAAFMTRNPYFGATVGRFANRIAKGQFRIEGKSYQLDINNGANALHGGVLGFDKRRWQVAYHSKQQVRFELFSADGDQGYPGNLQVAVTYTLTDDNALTIDYWAQGDKTTPVNLTNHAYFNLAGEGAWQGNQKDALAHSLQIQARHYLPTDQGAIPTGEHKSVIGTSFDFLQAKPIEQDFLQDDDQRQAKGYDHSLIFCSEVTDGVAEAARLIAPAGDVVMVLKTTKPAVQLYTGNFLAGTPGASHVYANHHGVALETQFFPDGPNHPEWGSASGLLAAGHEYQHRTVYQFAF